VLVVVAAAWGFTPLAAFAQAADPLEGLPIREVRITGLRHVASESVERHLGTRVGQPYRRAAIEAARRRLDELRLFASIAFDPQLVNEGVTLHVAVTETLRLLPFVVVRVTDENGLSAGPGLRAINLLGRESQASVAMRFGGEVGVSASVDRTTVSPGTWARHLGVSHNTRENSLYGFDEAATTADGRFALNWGQGLRTGASADLLVIGVDESATAEGRTDVIPTLGAFLTWDGLDSATNPRTGTWGEVEVNRRMHDAASWTFILDGRRFQRLSARQGIGLFSLATFQTGAVGDGLPDYLQFDLGGANSVRGWSLGSRRGRHQWIGTAEYSFVLRPLQAFSVAGVNLYAGVQLAAFADLGWTSNDGADPAKASAIDGYGLGLRFLVPFVDLVRLDVAWGEPGRGATAYFGVALKAARQRQRVR
jgi:outer membrane protein assembly factor BamA